MSRRHADQTFQHAQQAMHAETEMSRRHAEAEFSRRHAETEDTRRALGGGSVGGGGAPMGSGMPMDMGGGMPMDQYGGDMNQYGQEPPPAGWNQI
jgi:membrane protein involved in colicin uptake